MDKENKCYQCGGFGCNHCGVTAKGSNSASLAGSTAEGPGLALKPCPFCGAAACHFDPPNEVDDGYCCCSNDDCFACGFDAAVKDWNTRV